MHSINLSFNLLRNFSKAFIATYYDFLQSHTHKNDNAINLFFNSLVSKPSWLLSAEHAVLEIYYTVHRHLTFKLISQNSTFQPTHLKQLLPIAFVLHTNLEAVNCSNKQLKPLRSSHKKSYNISRMSPVNVWPTIGLHFTHQNRN